MISQSRIGIISDLHLGVHTNSTRWHELAINWAKWIKKEFKKHNIKDIVFCGDWHHNRSEISVNTLQVSADILHIFKDFNIIAVIGNHDIYYKHRLDVNSLSIFKGRKNITIVDNVLTIDAFDKTLTFCPWDTKPSEIPKSDVVFGHFEIETFKMNTYKMCEDGIAVPDLLSKGSLIISGHFHTRNEKKYGAGTILYVGNPFQMDFGDLDNVKGYYILDLDNLEYEFYENTISPQYKKIDLSEMVQEGTITPKIKNVFHKNIVKVRIDKHISQEDLVILTNRLNQLKPESLSMEYDLSFTQNTNNNIEKDLSGIDIEQAISEFVNLLEITHKKDIINYTLDLYKKCIA